MKAQTGEITDKVKHEYILYPSLLVAFGEHDNSLHIFLPDQSPEVIDSAGQWPLGCDKLLLRCVTLENHTVSVTVM